MKEERLKKMHEKRAEKKALKYQTQQAITNGHDKEPEKTQTVALPIQIESKLDLPGIEDQNLGAPRLIIKDGKLVVDETSLVQRESDNKLAVVDNKKPQKLTSMSFRQRNHTEKWTEEETRKFFKVYVILEMC
jgi:Transcription initiation factor TFIIIB, Bdp1 subunit